MKTKNDKHSEENNTYLQQYKRNIATVVLISAG